MEHTVRINDARQLEKIEELIAIARNEQSKHESLEVMVQTLEQQLQQQNDCIDKLMADWQGREDG